MIPNMPILVPSLLCNFAAAVAALSQHWADIVPNTFSWYLHPNQATMSEVTSADAIHAFANRAHELLQSLHCTTGSHQSD